MTESDYWCMKYSEACVDREAADVRYVMSYGAKIAPDGPLFGCLIGTNIQEGLFTSGKTPKECVEKMIQLLVVPARPEVKK